jgi:hypothetical protein
MEVRSRVRSLCYRGPNKQNGKRDLAYADTRIRSHSLHLSRKELDEPKNNFQKSGQELYMYIQSKENDLNRLHVTSGWSLDVADADWLSLPPLEPLSVE